MITTARQWWAVCTVVYVVVCAVQILTWVVR